MKPWKPLLALICLALAASPAAASVLFKGFHFTPQGACVADVGPDGQLALSNIGSSGQDGVSVDCLHMDGLRMALDGSCTAADAGASYSLQYNVSVDGVALAPRLRLGCAVLASRVDIRIELNDLASSPTQTVTLSRGGVVVYRALVPEATVASVAMDATGSCPNPTLSCSVAHTAPAEGTVRWHATASFTRVVHVSVAGHDDDCDDLEFSSAVVLADVDCDGLTGDLRVSSPAGSSLATVQCSSSSQSFDHHYVEASGSAELVVASASGSALRRLEVHNLGSSGQDGVSLGKSPLETIDLNGSLSSSSSGGASVACAFSPPSLVFDPATDIGASAVVTVVGRMFTATGTPEPVSASMKLNLSGGVLTGPILDVVCDHSGTGADVESVAVLSQGTLVERLTILPGASVQVVAPPGGPPYAAVASFGKKHELTGHVTLIKGPMFAVGSPEEPASSTASSSSDLSAPMQVTFRSSRLFSVGGTAVAGDELVCWGASSSPGTYQGSFDVVATSLSVRCPNPASPLSSMTLLDFSDASGDQVFADVSPTASLSTAHNCVSVPIVFARTDATPVRAFSVRFHLSPELTQCGASVVEGDYLSSIAGTHMFVTDNGGGSYTVDCGILGPVCGATGNGKLFSVDVGAMLPPLSDMGRVVVDAVVVRDCSNGPVPARPGGDGFIPIQFGAPAPITALTATQVKTGNLPGGTTGIDARWPEVSFPAATVDLYRKPYGNYPLYDDGSAPGSVPSPPATPAAALADGWSLASLSATGADRPPSRDFYYYVAFVRDLYGNASPVSNMTSGTLDYHLGDVSDGNAVCSGDNHVDILDITALGGHYGTTVPAGSALACLDVGPTTDFSVDARPTTDHRIEFEDFMMFAVNFGSVSAPAASHRPVAAAMNTSRLVVPGLPAVGETFDVGVFVEGAGDMQGLSARFVYDPAVLEQVAVAPGSLLDQQGRAASVLSSGPGDVDAALLGAGPGIAGSGEIARVTFRVRSAGEPGLALAGLVARDGSNQPIAVAGASGGAVLPAHTALGFAYPNPFSQSVGISLSLHATGPASIGIFDVAGRRVRTLVQGTQSAGTRLVTWDGRDDAGLRLAPGAYIVRLEAAGRRESRTLRLVR